MVTGANYLLDTGNLKILVDCGLFQGSKFAEFLNYEGFPYNPSDIDYLLLTHSHADHIGRIPKLYKDGFRGKIIATHPTVALIKAALPNTLALLMEEAKRDGHEPLFREDHLINAVLLAEGANYHKEIRLDQETVIKFLDAGHILGSSIIEITCNSKKVCFSGDLGNPPNPLLHDPDIPENPDYLIVESTYGSKIHEDKQERKNILEKVIDETVAKGGTLLIPSFAIERTQELLYELNEMFSKKSLPDIPLFLDSPLAIEITKVYKNHAEYYNEEALRLINSGDDIFDFPNLVFTKIADESKQINTIRGPKIIIAGSGMSNGGRILHHELRYLPDSNSAILFVGYQSEGSLGRRILNGDKKVSIFGKKIPVNCKVFSIGGYSGHADQKFILEWVKKINRNQKLKKIFIVQGEIDSAEILGKVIKKELNIETIVPGQGDKFTLE